MKCVIISRKRPSMCARASYPLFPDGLVSIAEDDVDSYVAAGIDRKRMLIHPNDVVGLCKKRNWVLKNVEDEVVVMADDDIECVACLVGDHYRRIREPEAIKQILENGEAGARAIGTRLFCLNSLADIRKYQPLEPFDFVGYPNIIHGLIGRELWYDETNTLHDDVDIALQAIRKFRVIWMDKRFACMERVGTTKMPGGCQGFISEKRDRLERAYLKSKWGKYYQMGNWREAGVSSHIAVQRKQSMPLLPGSV